MEQVVEHGADLALAPRGILSTQMPDAGGFIPGSYENAA